MTNTELNELKSSTKAELIQLIQDQTDNLQTFYEECEELRSAVAYRDGRIGVLKEEIEYYKEYNKKSEEKDREDRKKLYQEIADLQILHSPKEYMSFDRTKYFGKLSIVN